MIQAILRRMDRNWRGPAVRVVVKDHSYVLGRGEPATQVVIHRPQILRRLALRPSMAFGEGYMDGQIEVRGSLMDIMQGAYRSVGAIQGAAVGRFLDVCRRALRINSARYAARRARYHYDLGNEFYQLWLDPTMTYSCAYFLDHADDLAVAQQHKIDLLCAKVRLQRGMRLLDIGCGWGNLLLHAAAHHGVHATGITPSREQAEHIETRARQLGLSDRVHVVRGDWRSLQGRFDRIVSVGMFEHVPHSLYARFFRLWRGLLADGGLSLLHSIGRMDYAPGDPWIERYIFPGGDLRPIHEILHRIARTGMLVMDVENLRQHYARTLHCWMRNFARQRERVVRMFDERFARMWELYLKGSEAAFRWGGLHLWQIVIARDAGSPWPLNREVVGQLADARIGSAASILENASEYSAQSRGYDAARGALRRAGRTVPPST